MAVAGVKFIQTFVLQDVVPDVLEDYPGVCGSQISSNHKNVAIAITLVAIRNWIERHQREDPPTIARRVEDVPLAHGPSNAASSIRWLAQPINERSAGNGRSSYGRRSASFETFGRYFTVGSASRI
jgi:hypothetical protein